MEFGSDAATLFGHFKCVISRREAVVHSPMLISTQPGYTEEEGVRGERLPSMALYHEASLS